MTTRTRTKRKRPASDHVVGPRQLRAMELEFEGKRFAEIARIVGVSRQQVYKWHDPSKHPAFVAELDRQRRERNGAIGETVRAQQSAVVDGMRRALAVLLQISESGVEETRDRVRASEAYFRSAADLLKLSGFTPPAPPPEEQKPTDDSGFGRVLADIMKALATEPSMQEIPK